MKKKLVSLLLTAVMVMSLAACGSSAPAEAPAEEKAPAAEAEAEAPAEEEAPASDIAGSTLEIAVTYNEKDMAVFQPVVDAFTAETGVTVNIAAYGDDYEATMKTRMASNELPDVFQTHGWSILRYKEYLMDVTDQPWVADYDESALGVIQDSEGKIYVLMISELINATLVNLDVTDAAGVDPYSIHTWDDFLAACEKVKAAGYTPYGSAIGAGGMANIAGTFTTYAGATAEDGAAQLDGTWDWASYRSTIMEFWKQMVDNGYLYEDCLTMEGTAQNDRFAANQAAFLCGNDPGVFNACLQLNPEGRYAFLPTFASEADGSEHVGIGEGDTFGIWKDTENEAAAKAFLEFMARPENVKVINDSTGKISCLKSSMAIDESFGLKVFNEMKEKCADCNIFYQNLWDRQWMPSGMWGIFGNAGSMVVEDTSAEALDETCEYLRENYVDLWEAAHEG